MMAKIDLDAAEGRQNRPFLAIGLSILALFAFGFAFGAGSFFLQPDGNLTDLAMGAAGLAVAALSLWGALRVSAFEMPGLGTKTGRASLMMALSLIAGVAIAMIFPPDGVGSIFYASPERLEFEPAPAWRTVFGLIGLGIVVPLITWLWHRNVDELQVEALRDGALLAGYLFTLIAMMWWVLWRGGITGEPDGYVLFWIYILSWSAIALFRKFR